MGRMTMRCAVWNGGSELEMEEREVPGVLGDEVLISVAYSGICGSDMHIIDGGLSTASLPPPRVLGHEFSGVVQEVGPAVKGFSNGDRVVAHPNGPCGSCYFCRGGMENFCTDMFSVFKNPTGGSFADYVVVKARQLYHLPDGVLMRDGALVEPAAIAVHCLDRAELKPGQSVLIIGGGPIGQLTLQVARMQGASKIILSEPEEGRRVVAKACGADHVVDPLVDDLPAIVRDLTKGLGVDVCIEAVGNPSAIEQAVGLIRNAGRLVIVGWAPRTASISLSPYEMYRRELDIRGSFFSPYSFDRTISLLPRLILDPLVTHCFALTEINRALKAHRNHEGVKVLLRPSDSEDVDDAGGTVVDSTM